MLFNYQEQHSTRSYLGWIHHFTSHWKKMVTLE
ncbi:hypothetical protein Nmel_005154 [Mimus melanotis]